MSDVTLWWISLGLGLVVALVAVALLQWLYVSVRRIDREVRAVWEAATRVAANTATTWMLAGTPELVRALREEALRHAGFVEEAEGS